MCVSACSTWHCSTVTSPRRVGSVGAPGVFEGVRAYETARGPAIFRHQDHIDRLFKSAQMYYMDVPYSKEQIRASGESGPRSRSQHSQFGRS